MIFFFFFFSPSCSQSFDNELCLRILFYFNQDVMMKVMPYSQGSRAICILSATGSISNVTLRQAATSGGTLTYEVNLMNMESNFLYFNWFFGGS